MFLVFVIGGVIAVVAGGGSSTDKADDAGAFTICEQFVENRLQYPGSSDFGSIIDAEITVTGKDAVVVSYVDAANGFGAQTRAPFTCKVHYLGDDRWRLTSLDLPLE